MQLFTDKYQPKKLDQIGFGLGANQKLSALTKVVSVPHLIIRGCRGAGKRNRALLFLRETFGDGVFNTNVFTIDVDLPNKKTVALQVTYSPYHYQFNPSQYGVYDRVLIQRFIEQIVKVKLVHNKVPYRVIIMEDADLLTYEAQQSLRRTLETHIKSCRFMFMANREGHLIDPIESRCVIINVPSPSYRQVKTILTNIVDQETGSSDSIDEQTLNKIVKYSDRDLNRAICGLQRHLLLREPYQLDYEVQMAKSIVKSLIASRNMLMIEDLRKQINEMITRNIAGTEILSAIFKQALAIMPSFDNDPDLTFAICQYAGQFDHSIRMGGKTVYHIEAFCLKICLEFKLYMDEKSKEA